jgi:hypothetical protein
VSVPPISPAAKQGGTVKAGRALCKRDPARCRALQEASSGAKAESTPQPQGRCPSSFSREQCAAAVAAAEAAATEPATPQPLEQCPSSVSRSMCEAAMEASAEARR